MTKQHKELLNIFKKWLVNKPIYSAFTIKTYLHTLRYFFRYLQAHEIIHFRDISQDHLANFLYKGKKQSFVRATYYLRLAALSLFFNWAYEKRYCSYDPLITFKRSKLNHKPLKQKNPTLSSPIILNNKDQLIIINKRISKDFTSIRNKSIICLILASGLFAEEIIQLKIDDFYLSEGYIDIVGKYQRQRRIEIDKSICEKCCLEWLKVRKQWIQTHTLSKSFLFFNQQGSSLSKEMIRKIVSKFSIDLPHLRSQLNSEILRQTAICNWLRANYPVEYVARNAGLKTLAQIEKYKEYINS